MASEIPEYDNLRRTRIELLEIVERFVQGEHIHALLCRAQLYVIEANPHGIAAAFSCAFKPRMIDKDTPHLFACKGEKVPTI